MDWLVTLNIIVTVLVGFVLFLLKDIKDDIKATNAEILSHHSNFEIHCSKDKFKVQHLSERRI